MANEVEEDTWPRVYFNPEEVDICQMCIETCQAEHTGFFHLLDGAGEEVAKVCFGCGLLFANEFQLTAIRLAQADLAEGLSKHIHIPTIEATVVPPPLVTLLGPDEDDEWIISA